MKKTALLILLLIPFTVQCIYAENIETNSFGDAINNVQVRIGLQNNEIQIKTNRPLDLEITVKNISTNSPFLFYNPLAIFNGYPVLFGVTSPSGKDVSPPPAGFEHGSGEKVYLLPNQTYTYDVNLSYLCKFDELGAYKIVAKMNVSRSRHEKLWAVSNTLLVPVVPDQ